MFKKYLEITTQQKLEKKIIHTLLDGTKVCLVNGGYVRDNWDDDFIRGGHGYAYRFIPKDEIWIEKMENKKDQADILGHELDEWYDMKYKHKKYEPAHKDALKIETEIRKIKNIDTIKEVIDYFGF